MTYGGGQHYALIKDGRIVDGDGAFSPSSWTAKITSTARNAWRDLWFKVPGNKDWVPAEALRQRARAPCRMARRAAMRKHERDCVRICSESGLKIRQITYGKHMKLVCRQGTLVCPKTPSDHRWAKNLASIDRKIANQR